MAVQEFPPPVWWPSHWRWTDDGMGCWNQKPWFGQPGSLRDFLIRERDHWCFTADEIAAKARPIREWDDLGDAGGVYFFVCDGVITYVGLTNMLCRRLDEHERREGRRGSVFLLPLFSHAAKHIEGYYIHALNPPENWDRSRLGYALVGWTP